MNETEAAEFCLLAYCGLQQQRAAWAGITCRYGACGFILSLLKRTMHGLVTLRKGSASRLKLPNPLYDAGLHGPYFERGKTEMYFGAMRCWCKAPLWDRKKMAWVKVK